MAARLHYELGLSMGKTAAVLHEVFGIRITRGGVAQALARLGERCGPTYGALVSYVRGGLLVVMDETGWRVGGIKAWLWAAVAELVTVYAIRRGRGCEEAAELIGKDYAGLLVRDGWGPYRGFKKALYQTCAAHLLRRCREMLEVARGRGREIPKAVKAILSGALKLRDQRDAGEIAEADFRSSWTSWSNSSWLYWPVRSAAPTTPRAGSSVISVANSTPSSPSCVCQGCLPPIGWPSKRSDRQSSTARSGAATGHGTSRPSSVASSRTVRPARGRSSLMLAQKRS